MLVQALVYVEDPVAAEDVVTVRDLVTVQVSMHVEDLLDVVHFQMIVEDLRKCTPKRSRKTKATEKLKYQLKDWTNGAMLVLHDSGPFFAPPQLKHPYIKLSSKFWITDALVQSCLRSIVHPHTRGIPWRVYVHLLSQMGPRAGLFPSKQSGKHPWPDALIAHVLSSPSCEAIVRHGRLLAREAEQEPLE